MKPWHFLFVFMLAVLANLIADWIADRIYKAKS